MPQAVFHIVVAMFIAEFIRDYLVKDNKKFPIHYVFIAGIGGILPDLDVAAYWILYFFGFAINEVHRIFTHNLFVVAIFLILAAFTTKIKCKTARKHHLKLSTIFLMLALGVFIHLISDAIIAGFISPFYPFSHLIIGIDLVNCLPYALQQLAMPCLDAGIFILWLFWVEYKHKISNFI